MTSGRSVTAADRHHTQSISTLTVGNPADPSSAVRPYQIDFRHKGCQNRTDDRARSHPTESQPCLTSGAFGDCSAGSRNRENGRTLAGRFALGNVHEVLDTAEGYLRSKVGIGDPKPSISILYGYEGRVWSA